MRTTSPYHDLLAERPAAAARGCFLTGFHSIAPRYRITQEESLSWLAQAHVRAGRIDHPAITAILERYSASSEHIAFRGHEPADFTHQRWQEMELFGPKGSDLGQKTRFFDDRVRAIFERFYPAGAPAPRAIVHTTCTGYTSPSGAQRLVSLRDWGRHTEVLHAYHMGCYGAHPAVRIAAGLGGADVVHTELCSLHLDPALHDPAHLVMQSLFADGFIKYQVIGTKAKQAAAQTGFELLAARDEIIPDSTGAMAWATGPLTFTMELSKEVPVLLASVLPRFVRTLFEEAGLNEAVEKSSTLFAVHPGGPRIIELSQRILGLAPSQVRYSREVLREHGNMSSATLPHIWQKILLDPAVPDRTPVVSLGAGPGLTVSGLLMKKRT
jgi:predicted naringenin-chalcone synthase